jgi:hypothetical protein
MKYDFVEIGTSDFDTLIQQATDTTVGLSIEPVQSLLQSLPQPAGVRKLWCAVSADNRKSMLKVYHVPVSAIQAHGLPDWLRGCNSVGDYHVQHRKLNIEHLVQTNHVPCYPIGYLFERESVTELDLLKIDTEGQDCAILLNLAQWLTTQPATARPRRIVFESNELADQTQVAQVVYQYLNLGYHVAQAGYDTILEL